MNRFLKAIVTALPVVVIGTYALTASAVTTVSGNYIQNTKHNFAAGTYASINANGNNTFCQPCHTPHHAIVDANISTDLWNHDLSSASYTLYDGTTAGTSTTDSQGMDRVSRLCLGCHDGSVALDSYGMNATGTGRYQGSKTFNTGDVSNLGTDFTDDHPVGITGKLTDLNGVIASPTRWKTPTLSLNTDGTAKSVKMNNTLSLAKMSTGFVVGCKTCHNPHGTGTDGSTPFAHLLANDPSSLCQNCHNK
jgi:predicted CXXCH cytochrome family protein